MPQAPFTSLQAIPNAADIAAVTGVTTETALYSAGTWAPLPANSYMAPSAYRFYAYGTITTSTTPGNLTITPRIGTTTGGSSLGASAAMALTASITGAFWELHGNITVRTLGSGTSATANGLFRFTAKLATAGAGAVDMHHIFGNAGATFDSTAAQGLFIGVTPGATTVSITPRMVKFAAWN